jgi:hypothetical protein
MSMATCNLVRQSSGVLRGSAAERPASRFRLLKKKRRRKKRMSPEMRVTDESALQ